MSPESDVLYAWPVNSDHGTTVYEVILRRSGELECPCPGWIFKRKDRDGTPRPRTCKHVERLADEAQRILRDRRPTKRFTAASGQARPVGPASGQPVVLQPEPQKTVRSISFDDD